jgi:anti-sigma B factor antagonist
MTAASGILTGRQNGQVWLRIDGRGSHQNTCELKAYVQQQIETHGGQRVIVDLSFCTGMDSTFMGMLRCLSNRLEGTGGDLHVIHAGSRNLELLRGLGLDHLFTVDEQEEHLAAGTTAPEMQPLNAAAVCKQERTSVCLEAHEALVAADERNAPKFRDVIELMRGSEMRPAGAH